MNKPEYWNDEIHGTWEELPTTAPSTLKATPGPWMKTGFVFDHEGARVGTFDVCQDDSSGVGLNVAMVCPYGPPYFCDEATAEANANLIAAAPDGYSIIERLVQAHDDCYELRDYDGAQFTEGRKLLDDAKAYLARARGEA